MLSSTMIGGQLVETNNRRSAAAGVAFRFRRTERKRGGVNARNQQVRRRRMCEEEGDSREER